MGPRLTRLGISLLAAVLAVSSLMAEDASPAKRKIVSLIQPRYPELARKMQLSGTVRVEVLVGPNGSAKSTQVIGGSPVLAQSALEAIEKWRWAPAPQETRELIELNFHP